MMGFGAHSRLHTFKMNACHRACPSSSRLSTRARSLKNS
jgi:hypothetical protein